MTRATSALPPDGNADDALAATGGPPSAAVIRRLAIALLCASVIIAGLLTYLVARHRHQQAALMRPAGIPASVSTQLADLMQLSPVPASTAPGFALTDQYGRALTLASFRGRAIVLTFADPHCVDVCPIVSQEFIDAYRDLGSQAPRAVFIAVNVNPYYHGVTDVAAYSAEHQLTTIPTWYYVTGPLPALESVWRAYNIAVQARGANADVIHTSEVLFIDPSGRERYIATPMANYNSSGKAYLPDGPLAAWGQGIALIIRQIGR